MQEWNFYFTFGKNQDVLNWLTSFLILFFFYRNQFSQFYFFQYNFSISALLQILIVYKVKINKSSELLNYVLNEDFDIKKFRC